MRSSQHLSTYVIGKRHAEINTTLLHLEIGKAWEATAPTSSQHGRAELQSWENMYWKCVTMCTEKLPQHTLSSTGQKHIRNRVLPGARRNGVLPTALTYRHKGWGSHLWGCHLQTRSAFWLQEAFKHLPEGLRDETSSFPTHREAQNQTPPSLKTKNPNSPSLTKTLYFGPLYQRNTVLY